MMCAAASMPASPFSANLRGELLCDEPMSKHTSWRVGGAADWFYTPRDRADLIALYQSIPPAMAICWVGLGSNMLVRDGGFRGLVIRSHKALNEIAINDDLLFVEAGVSCAKAAKLATRAGMTDAAFLAGIPGSMGGALTMNAGAFAGETWRHVVEIECVKRDGGVVTIPAQQLTTGYRSVALPSDHWIISGTLRFATDAGAAAQGQQGVRELLQKRNASQPVQSANAGSVFRNPAGDYAARLIEAAGLKGRRIGDAEISTKHANFIVNLGQARAADIEALMTLAQQQVAAQFGVQLQPEVRLVGESDE